MAKRKSAAAEAVQTTHAADIPPPAETMPAAVEPPKTEAPPRVFLADPFPFRTEKLGNYRIHFQHSRQANEMQIRFGDGSEKDKPSDAVRDFIKSHKVEVEATGGEKKQVQLFHWNQEDRAWGMRIDRENPETSKQAARKIFDETVRLVAAQHGLATVPGR